MEKMNWAAKIKAFLKGGDDQKLARMNNRIDKYLSKQQTSRKDSITDLKEKLEDKQEELTSFVNTVDFDKLSSDTVEAHATSYVRGVVTRLQEIEEIEDDIKSVEKEMDFFKKAEKVIYADYVPPVEEKK